MNFFSTFNSATPTPTSAAADAETRPFDFNEVLRNMNAANVTSDVGNDLIIVNSNLTSDTATTTEQLLSKLEAPIEIIQPVANTQFKLNYVPGVTEVLTEDQKKEMDEKTIFFRTYNTRIQREVLYNTYKDVLSLPSMEEFCLVVPRRVTFFITLMQFVKTDEQFQTIKSAFEEASKQTL